MSAQPSPAFKADGTSVGAGRAQGLACGAPAGVSGCAPARAPASPPPLQQRPPATPAPRPAPGRPPPRPPPWRSSRSRRPSPPASDPGRAASASHSPSADTMNNACIAGSPAEFRVCCSAQGVLLSTEVHRASRYMDNKSLGWACCHHAPTVQGSDCQRLTSSLSLLRLRSKMICVSQTALQRCERGSCSPEPRSCCRSRYFCKVAEGRPSPGVKSQNICI